MEHIEKYVIDFVEGRVPPCDFIAEINKSNEILDWVQSIVPPQIKGSIAVPIESDDPRIRIKNIPVSYNIYDAFKKFEYPGFRKNSLGYQLNVHAEISRIMVAAFPEKRLVPDEKLGNMFSFLLEVCPSYIGGSEVDESGILEEVVTSIPKELSKTARQRWAKERIKELFHVEGRHRPYWIQEPEWPVYQGEPMEYVRTVKHGVEGQTHYFRDPKTGVERTVEDWH